MTVARLLPVLFLLACQSSPPAMTHEVELQVTSPLPLACNAFTIGGNVSLAVEVYGTTGGRCLLGRTCANAPLGGFTTLDSLDAAIRALPQPLIATTEKLAREIAVRGFDQPNCTGLEGLCGLTILGGATVDTVEVSVNCIGGPPLSCVTGSVPVCP